VSCVTSAVCASSLVFISFTVCNTNGFFYYIEVRVNLYKLANLNYMKDAFLFLKRKQ